MSRRLISRSPDLRRLSDEGYDLEIKGNLLLVSGVPYVTSSREVKLGTLVSFLDLAGDVTVRPSTHVAQFAGERPCHADGTPLSQIINSESATALGHGVTINFSFSSKPPSGYADYYEKVTTYVAILAGPAQAIDPGATARTYPVIEPTPEESVFQYLDTASTRAGIGAVTDKLKLARIAIVGLGGTGSYVLDFLAKTPVREIHLYDSDVFLSHNAFRSPGAPSLERLRERPSKVAYLCEEYSRMHRGIVAHDYTVSAGNAAELREMAFVFLCLDRADAKRAILAELAAAQVPFVDVGMGLYVERESIFGILRVTTSTPSSRGLLRPEDRIPLADGNLEDNPYATNIQVADLNALNAAFAVIRWKKLFGFYGDFEHEHFCAYTLDGNSMINEDHHS